MTAVTTGAGRGGVREKIEVTQELAKTVAELAVDGSTVNEIIKESSLSYPVVKKIMRSPEFTDQMKAIVRNKFAQLANKAVGVIEKQLEEGNLDAAKTVFKALAVLDVEPTKGADNQPIQIILPGSQPQPRDIPSEVTDAVPQESFGEAQ